MDSEVFIRFAIAKQDERTDQPEGIFSALYDLERKGALAPHERDWFISIETWFDEHLAVPAANAWKIRPRETSRAVTWFKESAVEHVSQMRALSALLEYKDIPVLEMRTENPGYVVYEDEHQVAAIPFGEGTRLRRSS